MLTESDGRHSIDARASRQYDCLGRERAQWNEFTAYERTVFVDVMSKKKLYNVVILDK